MTRADIAIVGAGMAGASLAAEVAGEASVLLLEAESHPGYHATGRSAAFWSETYGGPSVQPLTSASEAFLASPARLFSDRSFLAPRGAIHIADEEGRPALEALAARFAGSAVRLEPICRERLEARLPGLRPRWRWGLDEPTCRDIDVAALHAAYLRRAAGLGVRLVTDARLLAAERQGGSWRLSTSAGTFAAEILVDAAGAWADRVAAVAGERPLGIQPLRRTLAQLRVEPAAAPDLPLVIDSRERFYFKPEAGGRLWVSPHDETPSEPCDCAPEELDVALAVDRLEQVVDWRVERVERRWAGLRSFAPDRAPVYGFSGSGRGFFWCAGQGGFGIQTAPAGAKLAAALLLGRGPDPMVEPIDPAPYLASRFG